MTSLFEKIIVINLDRSPDKREKISKQLDSLKLDYTVLSGFDGNLITNGSFESLQKSGGYNYRPELKKKLTKTHMACSLSHVFAINLAKSMNYKNILVIEDDAVICEDFNDRILLVEKEVPKDWEHIYLGGMIWTDFIPTRRRAEHIYESTVISGTHAYVLNCNAYSKLSEYLSKLEDNVDGMLTNIIQLGIMKSYMFIPFFAYQDTLRSDIELGKIEDRSISKKFYSNKI